MAEFKTIRSEYCCYYYYYHHHYHHYYYYYNAWLKNQRPYILLLLETFFFLFFNGKWNVRRIAGAVNIILNFLLFCIIFEHFNLNFLSLLVLLRRNRMSFDINCRISFLCKK